MTAPGLAWRRESASIGESAKAAVAPFLVARAVVLGALLAAHLVVNALRPTGAAGARARGTVHAGLLSWDATWYRRIAELGYAGAGHEALRFFPLYPLAGRYLRDATTLPASAGLVVMANVFCFASLVVLHQLCSHEQLDRMAPERALWTFSLFPAAFVLVMGYSEALFIFLSLLAFYCWRTGRPGWSIVPAYLAGLTRPVGVLLAVPFLAESVSWWWRTSRHPPRQLLLRAAGVLAAAGGAASYLAWASGSAGGFFTPLTEQLSSGHRGEVADPFVTLYRDLRDLFAGHHLGTALHAPFLVAFVLLVIYLFARLPSSYGWYGFVSVVVAATAPNLDSLERYGLACFPLAIGLAAAIENRLASLVVLTGLGAALFGLSLLCFVGLYIP